MLVIGAEVVERHFMTHVGHKGIKATRTQYHAWLAIVGRAQWRTPEDVKASYPKASILKDSRVVFNIKGNDYRLIASVQYLDCERPVSSRSPGNPLLRDSCRIRQD
jgi:mRNA interferase HigB